MESFLSILNLARLCLHQGNPVRNAEGSRNEWSHTRDITASQEKKVAKVKWLRAVVSEERGEGQLSGTPGESFNFSLLRHLIYTNEEGLRFSSDHFNLALFCLRQSRQMVQ